MDLTEIWYEDVDRIHVNQDTPVATSSEHGDVPWDIIKGGDFLE
jgi:hypothetical protein